MGLFRGFVPVDLDLFLTVNWDLGEDQEEFDKLVLSLNQSFSSFVKPYLDNSLHYNEDEAKWSENANEDFQSELIKKFEKNVNGFMSELMHQKITWDPSFQGRKHLLLYFEQSHRCLNILLRRFPANGNERILDFIEDLEYISIPNIYRYYNFIDSQYYYMLGFVCHFVLTNLVFNYIQLRKNANVFENWCYLIQLADRRMWVSSDQCLKNARNLLQFITTPNRKNIDYVTEYLATEIGVERIKDRTVLVDSFKELFPNENLANSNQILASLGINLLYDRKLPKSISYILTDLSHILCGFSLLHRMAMGVLICVNKDYPEKTEDYNNSMVETNVSSFRFNPAVLPSRKIRR